MRINKYYCPRCNKTSGRRDVTYSEYTNAMYCRWCNNEVMYTEEIIDELICITGRKIYEKRHGGVLKK